MLHINPNLTINQKKEYLRNKNNIHNIHTLIANYCDVYLDEELDILLLKIINSETLLKLHMCECKVDSYFVSRITNQKLVDINFSYNFIGDKGAIHLAKIPTLRKVNLNFNYIGDTGMINILRHKKIRILYLDDNFNITNVGLEKCYANRIKEIELGTLNVSKLGLSYLSNSNLTKIKLHFPYIGDDEFDLFNYNYNIETLNIITPLVTYNMRKKLWNRCKINKHNKKIRNDLLYQSLL